MDRLDQVNNSLQLQEYKTTIYVLSLQVWKIWLHGSECACASTQKGPENDWWCSASRWSALFSYGTWCCRNDEAWAVHSLLHYYTHPFFSLFWGVKRTVWGYVVGGTCSRSVIVEWVLGLPGPQLAWDGCEAVVMASSAVHLGWVGLPPPPLATEAYQFSTSGRERRVCGGCKRACLQVVQCVHLEKIQNKQMK